MAENYREPAGLNEAAGALGITPAYLSTTFKAQTGETFLKRLTRMRMDKAKELIERGAAVGDVARSVGIDFAADEVVIAVETREPVAALASDPQRTAIDKDGVVFEAAEVLPKKLPKVTAEGAALPAAMQVLVTLPEDLSKRVVAVTATTLDDIDLSLRSGDTVRWGSADRGDVKAEVLRALLKRKADLYDVSAPELPTTFRLS